MFDLIFPLVFITIFIIYHITTSIVEVLPQVGTVLSVSLSPKHNFSKPPVQSINLLKNLGVDGDAHCGEDVQHLSRQHIVPLPPNLRQVHLIQSELLEEFRNPKGNDGEIYDVEPGDLGENITTAGLDLLAMGKGTKLHFMNPPRAKSFPKLGEQLVTLRVTGLRNPCHQINAFRRGLQERCLERDVADEIAQRKAGIFAVVEVGGVLLKGAKIWVEESEVFEPLECV